MGRVLFVAAWMTATVAVAQSEPAPAEQAASPAENKPAEAKAAPEAKPAAPEAKPAAPEAKPAAPEPKPAEPKTAAPAEKAPAAAEAKPAAPRAAPGEKDAAPAENKNSPTFGLSDEDAVAYEARLFFLDILSSDARSLTDRAAFPFSLEDRRFNDEDSLFGVWLKSMRQKRTDLLTLYGVEVLTPEAMEKKYGRPPARLAQFNYKGPRTYVAVGNLSGRPAVVVYRFVNNRWKAVGYHD